MGVIYFKGVERVEKRDVIVRFKYRSNVNNFLNILSKQRTLLILIVTSIIISFLIPSFLTTNNLLNLLRQVSINGIIAVGMTFVIATGGIDISVGSSLALGGVVVGLCLKMGVSVLVSIIIALLVTFCAGLLNGVIVAYGHVLPFVATLGTMYVFRGITLIISRGQAIWGLPSSFIQIGTGYIFDIPIPVIIMLSIYILGWLLLKFFTFGRHVLGIGGNEEAARLCGVSVQRVKMFTYGLSGILCGTAGVILAARLGSAQPSVGTGYELSAIAACVIGGNSLIGGKGTIFGTLLGVLILGVISNALNLWGVASFFQTVITGCIVLLTVLLDAIKK